MNFFIRFIIYTQLVLVPFILAKSYIIQDIWGMAFFALLTGVNLAVLHRMDK